MTRAAGKTASLRVNFVPDTWDGPWVMECSIILRFLERVTGRSVEIVRSHVDADLSLVYLFPIRDELERIKKRTFRISPRGRGGALEEIIRRLPTAEKVLIVATENLDHVAWAEIGYLLIESNIPRVSFYPEEVDCGGARLPYWWNYLDWPQYPRPEVAYGRYGRLYSLERLMSPLGIGLGGENRDDAAVYISSHQVGIRNSVLRGLESRVRIEKFGKVGRSFSGPKIDVLRQYRFAIATENSLGFGYVTEKLPEAWDAGCIPLGLFVTPGSDFAYHAFSPGEAKEAVKRPLLEQPPDEGRVLDYLSNLF